MEHLGGVVLHRVGAHQRRDRIAVADGLAVADQVGFEAEVVGGAAEAEPEPAAHVVDDEDDAVLVAELPDAASSRRPAARCRRRSGGGRAWR